MSRRQPRWMKVSVENISFQHLEALKRNRERRRQYGEIFVEGVANINALLEAKHPITSIAFSADRTLSAWARAVIDRSQPERVYSLDKNLMTKLSDRADPSELIVTAKLVDYTLGDIPLTRNLFAIIFERPSSPGNLGTLVRSSDAFDVDAIIATGHGVDIWDPAVIRASLGAVFHRRTMYIPSATELETWIATVREAVPNIQIVGTAAKAPRTLPEWRITTPVVIILGNEARGLSARLDTLADFNVSIPMKGNVDSLNVACAGSILMYEVRRNTWLRSGRPNQGEMHYQA